MYKSWAKKLDPTRVLGGDCALPRESQKWRCHPDILRPPLVNQCQEAASRLDCFFLSPGLHCQGLFLTHNLNSSSWHVGGSRVNHEAWGKAEEWASWQSQLHTRFELWNKCSPALPGQPGPRRPGMMRLWAWNGIQWLTWPWRMSLIATRLWSFHLYLFQANKHSWGQLHMFHCLAEAPRSRRTIKCNEQSWDLAIITHPPCSPGKS